MVTYQNFTYIYCVMRNYAAVCIFLLCNWEYINCCSSAQLLWRNTLTQVLHYCYPLRVMLPLLPPFCASPASSSSALWWILTELKDLRCFCLYVLNHTICTGVWKYFVVYCFVCVVVTALHNLQFHCSPTPTPTPFPSRCRMHLIWGTIEFPVFHAWVWELKGISRNRGEVAETKGPHFEWFVVVIEIRNFSP